MSAGIQIDHARRLADALGLDIVVIVGWHAATNRTELVTWGRTGEQKAAAANVGDRIEDCLGCGEMQMVEDFRVQGAAAEEVDRLRRLIELHVKLTRQEQRDETQCPPEALCKIDALVDVLEREAGVGGK